MSRPLRIEFDGALYHVTSRGNTRQEIYLNDSDRESFLDVLASVCERYNWVVHAYCLMSNHYHLLIETPDGNLSKGMRQLNGVYTQNFNREHQRVGHVFQGRYKSILVEKQAYLLELTRYIVLNPVRAQMVRSAKDWKWSSYRASVAQSKKTDWLNVDWLLSQFAKTKGVAIKRYKDYVKGGKNQSSPMEALKNQIYLGSNKFVESMLSKLEQQVDPSETPKKQRTLAVLTLEDIKQISGSRNEGIVQSYFKGHFTLKQIGDFKVSPIKNPIEYRASALHLVLTAITNALFLSLNISVFRRLCYPVGAFQWWGAQRANYS